MRKLANLIASSALLLGGGSAMAQDTIAAPSAPLTRHEQRIERYVTHWQKLIPTQFIVQYAGNMGLLSIGTGWDYGRNEQWETQIFIGFLPKYHAKHGSATFTLKQNFIPWKCDIGSRFTLHPFHCGLYINAITGDRFWAKEPSRYPSGFYWQSTKFRCNVFVGQQIDLNIPYHKRRNSKSITFFYEASTNDLTLRSLFQEGCHPKFTDIVTLSLGLKMKLM